LAATLPAVCHLQDLRRAVGAEVSVARNVGAKAIRARASTPSPSGNSMSNNCGKSGTERDSWFANFYKSVLMMLDPTAKR
jgi:hypothetical protein